MDELLTEEAALLKAKNKIRWGDILGSALLFASAYLFLYILYDLATAVTAAHFGLKPTLYFDTIDFANRAGWYPRCVKITFSIGIPVMLITGIGFYFLYLWFKTSSILLRLSLLWLSLLSFVILSQRLIGAAFATEFQFSNLDSLGLEIGIVEAYYYMKTPAKAAMAMVGILVSLAVGFLYAKPFLQTATSVYQIDIPVYRKRFLWHHLIAPSLIGAMLITMFVFPKNTVPNFMSFAVLPISLLSIWFFATHSAQLIRKQSFSRFWFVFPAIIFGVIILVIKTVLKTGIFIPNLGLTF